MVKRINENPSINYYINDGSVFQLVFDKTRLKVLWLKKESNA